jgi:hypothetical protein
MDVQLIHPWFDDELYHKQAFLVKNQVLEIKIGEEKFCFFLNKNKTFRG